jgi:predicted secreted hydrolase
MDHEFGTSFLEARQVGWDWFSLQLEDGRDLMLFRLRRADGTLDPHSSATLVGTGGETVTLSADEFELVPGRTWTSPESGGRYPVDWRIRVPGHALDLHVHSALDTQELRTEHSTGVAYWEGAVDAEGRSGDQNVRGTGYLEMTGYAGAPLSTRFR